MTKDQQYYPKPLPQYHNDYYIQSFSPQELMALQLQQLQDRVTQLEQELQTLREQFVK